MGPHKSGSIEAMMVEKRRVLIEEQIAAGMTSATKIFKKLMETEPFLNQNRSTMITFCWHCLRQKNELPDRQEMFNKRHALIDEQIAAGMTSSMIIANKLKETEPFQRCQFNTIQNWCYNRLLAKGVTPTRSTSENHAPHQPEPAPAVLPSETHPDFDELIGQVSLNLPLGAHREVEKLLKVIRPEYEKLIAKTGNHAADEIQSAKLKRKIADLEAQITDLRTHQCPDASADLQNENQELRTKIRELALRVEALSRATAPRLVARPGFGG